MTLKCLPLTRQDTEPRYTAADWRRLITPWLSPWGEGFAASPFTGVSAVRWGTASPLVEVTWNADPQTVTVHPHAGLVKPFTLLQDTYTYYLDEDLTLDMPTSTSEGSLYVFLSVEDPSLGYGDTPGVSIQIVDADQRAQLHGYTLAEITASNQTTTDIFPWILSDGTLVVRDSSQLSSLTPGKMTRARALITDDTTGVHYTDFIYDGSNWRYASPTRLISGQSWSTSSTTTRTIPGLSDFIFTSVNLSAFSTRPIGLTHPEWDTARWAMPWVTDNQNAYIYQVIASRSGDQISFIPTQSGAFEITDDRKVTDFTIDIVYGLIPMAIVTGNWYPTT